MRRGRKRSTACSAPACSSICITLCGTPCVQASEVIQSSGWRRSTGLTAQVRSSFRHRPSLVDQIDLVPACADDFAGAGGRENLVDANAALANLQANLELSDVPYVSDEIKATVRAYNEDDCRSTLALRDWLETLRANLITRGLQVPRPQMVRQTRRSRTGSSRSTRSLRV